MDTGPLPIFGLLNEAAADGVVMDVGDLAEEFVLIADVAVESATGLPEAGTPGVGSQSIQDRSVEILPARDDLLRDGLLDEMENRRDGAGRVEDDVHMLRHDDPGVESKAEAGASSSQGIDEDVPGPGFAEQRETTLTGESHKPQAALAATEGLSQWRFVIHVGRVSSRATNRGSARLVRGGYIPCHHAWLGTRGALDANRTTRSKQRVVARVNGWCHLPHGSTGGATCRGRATCRMQK